MIYIVDCYEFQIKPGNRKLSHSQNYFQTLKRYLDNLSVNNVILLLNSKHGNQT
jgi:hypothetical protein